MLKLHHLIKLMQPQTNCLTLFLSQPSFLKEQPQVNAFRSLLHSPFYSLQPDFWLHHLKNKQTKLRTSPLLCTINIFLGSFLMWPICDIWLYKKNMFEEFLKKTHSLLKNLFNLSYVALSLRDCSCLSGHPFLSLLSGLVFSHLPLKCWCARKFYA